MSTAQLKIDLPPNLSSDEARLLLAIKLYEEIVKALTEEKKGLKQCQSTRIM